MNLRPLSFSLVLLFACGDDKTDTQSTGSATDTTGAATDSPATDPTDSSTTIDPTDTQPTVGTTTGGSDTVDPGETTGTTDELTTTGGELHPACACIESGGCGGSLCSGEFGISCESECQGDEPIENEAALQCALEALRDRTPGKLGWFTSEFIGQFSSSTDAYILDDGHILLRRSGDADLCSYTGPDSAHTLADAAHFEGCLALATARERWTCLHEGVLSQVAECVPEESMCEV